MAIQYTYPHNSPIVSVQFNDFFLLIYTVAQSAPKSGVQALLTRQEVPASLPNLLSISPYAPSKLADAQQFVFANQGSMFYSIVF